ncbi:MAG: TolC family protein [Alphaproteobacteria bacterium]|nr:TolC family protein [Alphaproteobacteria bacterium]
MTQIKNHKQLPLIGASIMLFSFFVIATATSAQEDLTAGGTDSGSALTQSGSTQSGSTQSGSTQSAPSPSISSPSSPKESARLNFLRLNPSNQYKGEAREKRQKEQSKPYEPLKEITFPFFTPAESKKADQEAQMAQRESARLAGQATGIAIIEKSLRYHPAIASATQDICEAQYSVLLGKTGYYPRINMNLSGGDKWVDETTRVDVQGNSTSSPEYDSRGVNATLTLRQPLYDWGRTSATIRGAKEQRGVAVLNRTIRMEEQLAEFYRMAFQYVLQTQLISHVENVLTDVQAGVDTMEARFKAGAARLADVRQAKIYQLEAEGLFDQATRDRDAVVRAMDTTFGLNPKNAENAVRAFITARPDIPAIITADETFEARLIRRNIMRAKAEHRRLQAERLPAFEGVVTARIWDIKDIGTRCQNGSSSRDCSTHEVVGAIEFNMPLFDGGANAAQRGGLNAQRRGLEAELASAERRHDAESRRVQDRLLGQIQQLSQGAERLTAMSEQFESQKLVQERTRADPLGVMSLQQNFSNAQAQQLGLAMQAELTRMEALFRAGRLSQTLNIEIGDSGC